MDAARFGTTEMRQNRLRNAYAAGVRAIVVPAVEPHGWDHLRPCPELAGIALYFCLGIHPYAIGALDPSGDALLLGRLEQRLAGTPEGLVAVGECGLDYRRSPSFERPRQVFWLERQLELADRLGLPVVVHCVAAHGTMVEVLEAHRPRIDVVLHAYSGGAALVERYLRARTYFSFSGAITRPSARRVLEAAKVVPRDRLLIETDSPDQTPEGMRAPNDPANVVVVARVLAEQRGVSLADIAETTFENAARVFRVPGPR